MEPADPGWLPGTELPLVLWATRPPAALPQSRDETIGITTRSRPGSCSLAAVDVISKDWGSGAGLKKPCGNMLKLLFCG